jgi:hypothetical protein
LTVAVGDIAGPTDYFDRPEKMQHAGMLLVDNRS